METSIEKACLIVSQEGCTAVYDTNTNELYRTNQSLAEAVRLVQDSASFQNAPQATAEQIIGQLQFPDKVEHVTFCSAAHCNMRCKYCFADGGQYGNSGKKVIRFVQYKEMLDFLFDLNPAGVSSMHFFGGEPMLGIKEIKAFCEYANSVYDSKGIPRPAYTMTTNATLISREDAAFFAEYHFAVCVSMDGPKEVHNKYRIFPDGSGTFDLVMEKARMLSEYVIPLYCEGTLPIESLEAMSREDIYKLLDFFSHGPFQYVDVYLSSQSNNYNLAGDAAAREAIRTYAEVLAEYLIAYMSSTQKPAVLFLSPLGMITKLISGGKRVFCTTGASQVFLTPDGEVYPCHLYYAAHTEQMGHIQDEQRVLESQKAFIASSSERLAKECINCLYANYCGLGCSAMNLLASGSFQKQDPLQCAMQKALCNQFIWRLGCLTKEPEKYKVFKSNIRVCANILAKSSPGSSGEIL